MVVNLSEILGVVLAISILSWTFKPNPVHRIIESIYIGLTAGYLLMTNLTQVYRSGVQPLSTNAILVIPLILGILMYARLSKKYAYISNYPIAVLSAIGVAVCTRAVIQSDIIKQIINTAIPMIVPANGLQSIGNIVLVISVVSSLFYFTYSLEHTGAKGLLAKIGMATMMIGFGANSANILLSRSSRFITMLGYIMVPSGMYVAPVMVALIALSIYAEKKGYI